MDGRSTTVVALPAAAVHGMAVLGLAVLGMAVLGLWSAPALALSPGAAGLDTLLSLVLGLVEAGVLPLSAAIARLTAGPAAVLGVERGTLAPGRLADICVFEPGTRWTVDPARWSSRGKNSPFAGREVSGRVRFTLLGGDVVHDGSTRR